MSTVMLKLQLMYLVPVTELGSNFRGVKITIDITFMHMQVKIYILI